MKALIYTLILTVILIGSLVYLQTLSPEQPAGDYEPKKPMKVTSRPPDLSGIDQAELDTTNLDALYDVGLEMLDLWHLPEAIDVFKTVVAANVDHAAAHLRLAECYAHPMVGGEREVHKSLENARDAAIRVDGDTLWISALSAFFGRGADSATQIRAALKSAKGPDDAEYYLAAALFGAGDIDAAERVLENLLEADQSLGRVRELLVRCRVARGEYQEAEALARELATIYPEEPYPYVLLSRILLIQGKLDEAEEFGNTALAFDDRYLPAIVAQAHLHASRGRREAAIVSFEKLLLFDDPMTASVGKEGVAFMNFLSGRFDAASQDLDDAIRLAMSVGSTRRGLLYTFRLVDYLCELGRADAAQAALNRWVTRYGGIPTELGILRIRISEGDLANARRVIDSARNDERWEQWFRFLELDHADIEALAFIKEKNFNRALDVLGAPDNFEYQTARRSYLRGFAAFEVGDAERAAGYFAESKMRLHSVEFPYHSDPVLYVQSIFYLAEAALARGDVEAAIHNYEDFLEMWGETTWDLQAVGRASLTLENLSGNKQDG